MNASPSSSESGTFLSLVSGKHLIKMAPTNERPAKMAMGSQSAILASSEPTKGAMAEATRA